MAPQHGRRRGPIGALMVLVVRHAGAAEIVVTDVAHAPLVVARRLGSEHAFNVAREATALDPWRAGKGTFDVPFEASGKMPPRSGWHSTCCALAQ